MLSTAAGERPRELSHKHTPLCVEVEAVPELQLGTPCWVQKAGSPADLLAGHLTHFGPQARKRRGHNVEDARNTATRCGREEA